MRDVVRYMKFSPNRFQTFKKRVEKLKIESKALLCLDVPTRWNSNSQMSKNAEKYDQVFKWLEDDPGYLAHFLGKYVNESSWESSREPPNEDDWDNCRTFVKFLKILYNAMKRFWGSLYVTSNVFFNEMFFIQTRINKFITNQVYLLASMARNMKGKFDKYWGMGMK